MKKFVGTVAICLGIFGTTTLPTLAATTTGGDGYGSCTGGCAVQSWVNGALCANTGGVCYYK